MNKIFAIVCVALFIITGCNKRADDISQVQTVSAPTIIFPGGQYFSINTGGTLPQITVTAYDSLIGEAYPAQIVGLEEVDNMTPGLYVVNATSTNKYGFVGTSSVFIAVTNVDPAIDLSGDYVRAATGGTANVVEVANGLYTTNNVGGVDETGSPELIFPVVFVQLNDTTINIAAQPTPVGTIESADEFLEMTPTDTTFGYRLSQGGTAFGTTALRIFEKQ